RRVIFLGERLDGVERLLRSEIDGGRRNRRLNKRIAFTARQEFFGVVGRLRVVLVVRDRKVDPRFSENAAQSGGLGFFGDGILEVVHVRESGDAAANHLGGSEARAPTVKILGDVFA